MGIWKMRIQAKGNSGKCETDKWKLAQLEIEQVGWDKK